MAVFIFVLDVLPFFDNHLIMRKSLRSQKLCRHSAIFTCTLRCHSPAMKHNKSVAYIFRWKTPVTWPKYWHWFFLISGVICHLSIDIRIEIHFFVCIGKWKANKKKCTSILKCVKILFFVWSLRSPVSQNLYCQYLNDFYIFLARKYASSDTPLIVAIITKDFRIWQKSTVSHSRRFCRFSLAGNTNFHRMF